MSAPAEPGPRPPWRTFREALEAVGFRPSRRLGQNFLLDDNMARAIARDSATEAGDFVLEVGPGCGFLSVHLAARGVRLLAVEIDPRLAEVARRFLAGFPGTEVVGGDVLEGPDRLAPEVEERLPAGDWHLAANLPYSISGPLLATLAQRERPPASATVLVQQELAERLAARPGTRAWGPLSVAVQTAFVPRAGRAVGRELFWPRPKVESRIVHLERRADLAPVDARRRLNEGARALLGQRRKALSGVVGRLLGRERSAAVLAELGLEPLRRGETLDLVELGGLVDALGSALPGESAPGGDEPSDLR